LTQGASFSSQQKLKRATRLVNRAHSVSRRILPGQKTVRTLIELDSPADIGIDRKRGAAVHEKSGRAVQLK
jgi:hypothetical protein